jgi:mRNA-degrading endonuclease RelE of RelBE toxin-antitoxin system
MSYAVLLHPDVDAFLSDDLDEKSERICRENLGYLTENPYPGQGRGDKEQLPIDGEQRYRIHVGRTWTAFYSIVEDEREVRVTEILPIDEAHKRYGF